MTPSDPKLLAAIRRSVRDAVREHALVGNPVCIWRDERVVWLSPEEALALLRSQEPAVAPESQVLHG